MSPTLRFCACFCGPTTELAEKFPVQENSPVVRRRNRALLVSDSSMLLKRMSDSPGSRSVFVGRARDLGSEPTYELGVYQHADILCGCASSKPRQDGAGLRLVLIGVGFEV